jgi:DNA topoisomerase-2
MEMSLLQSVNENMLMNKKKNEDGEKRLFIERIYQKKKEKKKKPTTGTYTVPPETYIGSVELVTQQMWI